MTTSLKALTWDEMLVVPPEKLPELSRVPIKIYEDSVVLFYDLARYTIDLIKENNRNGQPTRIAWPIGPKKHFPLLIQLTNEEKVSWKNTINFQVDEWLDWQCRRLPENDSFNLQSFFRRELIDKLDPELRPDEDHLIFHDPLRLDHVDKKLDEYGGIDVLFGGFGFTGHIAYNEPPTSRWIHIGNDEFRNSRSRIVPTNDETFIVHSQRSTGGNTRRIPPMAITIGMKDILAARQIRLVSDGGAWKQTILRVMCFHEPTVQFPCTFVQGHPGTQILVDTATAACPSLEFIG